jgi:hypothetical protein
MDPVSAVTTAASIWNGWNIGKIFSNCLTTEVHFTNNTKAPLKFVNNLILSGSITATEPVDLPGGLLMPG